MATVGSASVDIVPSVKGFREKLDAALKNISDVTINVDADVSAAKAKIEELIRARQLEVRARVTADPNAAARGAKSGDDYGDAFSRIVKTRIEAALRSLPEVQVGLTTTAAEYKLKDLQEELAKIRDGKVGVDFTAAEALAKIDEFRQHLDYMGNKSPDIQVRANTLSAIAELDKVRAQLDGLNGKTAVVEVRTRQTSQNDSGSVSGTGAGFSGGGLLAAAVPLAALAIPIGAAGIGLAAGIGGGALAAAGALGALTLGLSGVGTAVQAVQAQQQSAGTDAATYANAQASAASGVASAQASLANASRAAGIAATTSAAAIAAAQVSLVDAQRSATTGVSSALVQQESAERSLISAQQAETNAQNALTVARRTAQQQIEDLTNSVADGALQQRAAALSVIQAENNLNLARINPNATRFQQEQAQLSYDQAVQQVTDLATRQTRLVEQKKVADRAGVDGAVAVVAAQQAVGNAVVGTAVAQEGLTRSTAAVTEARRAGAESVAKAELAVTAAQQAQANSAASSAASIAGAQASLSDALRQQAVAAANLGAAAVASKSALDALSPAARDFAIFVAGTLEPALKNLKAAAADGLLPGLQAGLVAIMPLMPIFADIIGRASKALGDLFAAAGLALNTPFYQGFFTFIRDSAGPAMKTFGDIIGGFTTGALGLFQAFAPVIAQVGGGLAGLATNFANFGTTLATNNQFQTFLAYVIASGPLVATFLGDLFRLIGNLIQGLAPLGTVLLIVVDALAKFLVSLGPNGLLIAIAAVAGAVAAFTGGIGAIAIGITALIALIVNAYQNIQPFRDYIDQSLVPALKTLAGIIVDGASKALATLQKAFEDNQPAITTLATVIGRVLEIFVSLAAFLAAGAISLALQILAQTVSDVAGAVTSLGKAYTFVVTANGRFKDTTEESVAAVGRFTGNITGLTPKIDLLKTANDNLRDAQDNLNTAVQKSIDKFTILNGGAAAQQKANDNLAASADALTKSVQTNGTSLDGNTAAGRANKAGIEANLSALNDKITADLKANTSTLGHAAALEIAKQQLIDGRTKLIDQATQLGINQGAAKGMVDQLLLTPKDLQTQFSTPGADQALAAAKNLKAVLDGIVDKTVTVTISGGYKEIAAQNAQGAGRTAIAATNAEGGHIRGEGTGTSDSILSYLSNGEFVVKASETAKHLPLLHALNDGQVPGYAAGGTVNIVEKANLGGAQDGISSFMKNLDFSKVLGNSASSAPGAGDSVTQWAPVILQALGLQGLPANYLAGVENVIKFESGGNPTAINLTDSNAVAGHPSQGLMQTIPTTFAAYAGPYASRGITDPLANIYAGVAYAMANYGPGFFANGGRHDSGGGYLGYDSGGYIPPGTSQIYNGTGRPEMVFTPEQLSRRDAQGGGSAQFTGTVVNGNQYVVDPDAHAAAERVNMRRASLQYGLGR